MSKNNTQKYVETKVMGRVRRRVTVQMAKVEPNLLTQQQFRDETNVNRIVARAMKGQAPAFLNEARPSYGDVSEVPSLAKAYEVIESAEARFMELPAAVRRELDNDPRKLFTAPREFFEKHGLLRAPEAPEEPQATGSRGVPPGSVPKGQDKAPKAPKEAPKKEPQGTDED